MNIKSVLILFIVTVVLLTLGGLVYLWLSQPATVYVYWSEASQPLISAPSGQGEPLTPTVTPLNTDFTLVISKINVNVPIIADVDGSEALEYLWQVKKGVAHYKHKKLTRVTVDGAKPGEGGNIFLFGHSQIPGGDTSNFQGVFNDLHKLIPGDEVLVYYQGQEFKYQVTEGKVVERDAVEYLAHTTSETLSLMTCWPLGLDVKRYLILAKRV